jgi:choline-sulfatase
MPSAIGMSWNLDAPGGPLPPAILQGGLGHLFRSAGYDAVFAGKQHLPSQLTAQDLGFEILSWDQRDRLAVEASAFLRRPHERPWLFAVNFINPHDICFQALQQYPGNERYQQILDRTKEPLDEIRQALELPGFDAASADESAIDRYCPPLPDNLEPDPQEPRAFNVPLDEAPFRWHARDRWGEREWRLHRLVYHRLTERVDSQIAVLLDALETSGHIEDTVVIFTSDHGDMDGSHRLEHKSFFYDESLRVPLIIHDPSSERRGVIDHHLCQNGIDLMATCCDYAGIEQPAHNRGLSWRRLLQGNPAGWRDGVYTENMIGTCWVTQQFKYCRYTACGVEEQLFDLANDPGEKCSRHADPAYTEALANLRESLAAARASHAEDRVPMLPPSVRTT